MDGPENEQEEREARALDALPLRELSGVGPARERMLAGIGLESVRDLLLFAPRRLEWTGEALAIADARAAVGQTVWVRGTIVRRSFRRFGKRATLRFALEADGSSIEVCYFNQPWLRDQLLSGELHTFAGRVVNTERGPALISPKIDPQDSGALEPQRFEPVYPASVGLGQELLRGLVRRALDEFGEELEEPLSPELLERLELPSLPEAVRALHAPRDEAEYSQARRRGLLEELLAIQARVLSGALRRSGRARQVPLDEEARAALVARFPFQLTGAQLEACEGIANDLACARPMRRLVQGDVGSGKTAVGVFACAAVARAGAQAAFLAPTELLAEQHFASQRGLLEGLGLRAELMTGTMRARERKRIRRELEAGEIDVLFGTHALMSASTDFRELALAVIDEQHRFGVAQRARLLEKGRDVHALLMTATPIPRTLAMTVYADLDTSVLREKPPGRAAITTRWLRRRDRERLPAFLRERLEAGEQVYWVAPRIGEEQEDEEAPAVGALRAFERLSSSELAPFGVELVHGRQERSERAERLERFRAGEARLLVATTIVEVGVDVPAATVMVIEGAERLGLAQLHQLRGRVGRGERASWCLLFGKPGARERFERLERIDCGFELAEEDLRQRGMGELAGLRQSGGPMTELEGELDLLLAARDALQADPRLVRRYATDSPSAAVHAP